MAVDNAQIVSDSLLLFKRLGQLPEPVSNPYIIAVSGLPGTGKSYLSRKLLERLPAVLLESDALRKMLFPSPDYTSTESIHLFAAIHLLLGRLLGAGIPVILDATNLSERNREYLYSIAEHNGTRLILVQVEAPPEVVKQRLQLRRTQTGSNSDADWAVYLKLKPTVNRIRRRHYTIDTSRDITEPLGKIVREALD